jgi:alanyl-tRNA synthetase
MSSETAKQSGALAFFGEKYGEEVRVLSLGPFSKELCGGTHVKQTGDIGLFKITLETGIAAGVRRIEAVTGEDALAWVEALEEQLQETAELFKTGRENLLEKTQKSIQYTQQLEKQVGQLENRLANMLGNALIQQAIEIKGIHLLVAELEGLSSKGLRELIDTLKQKLANAVIILGNITEKQVQLAVGVTKNSNHLIKANELINAIAGSIGGKGGGRPDFAQAGGDNPHGLKMALQDAVNWIKIRLN